MTFETGDYSCMKVNYLGLCFCLKFKMLYVNKISVKTNLLTWVKNNVRLYECANSNKKNYIQSMAAAEAKKVCANWIMEFF